MTLHFNDQSLYSPFYIIYASFKLDLSTKMIFFRKIITF